MAWMALAAPIVSSLLSSGKEQPAPGPSLPPAPSLADKLAANQAKYDSPMQFSSGMGQGNPFSQLPPIGGGIKG